jgi:hypothetical protein
VLNILHIQTSSWLLIIKEFKQCLTVARPV